MQHQVLEDGPLARRELDGGVGPAQHPRGAVELEAEKAQRAGAHRSGTANEHPASGDQLAHLEGLDHVVVSTAIEARDPVVEPVAGREHQHRDAGAIGHAAAQAGQELQAIAPGQPEVEDDQVEVLADQRGIGRFGAADRVDHEPGVTQP